MSGIVPVSAGADEVAVECVPVVDDAVAAAQVAAECGSEVEIRSERSPWDTVFATPAGGMRVETSAAAVRTEVNGSWQEIDTTLALGAAGVEAAAAALPIVFSDGSAGMPLARIESGGHVLEFHAPFELTAPSVSGDRVTYPDVLPGVDLIASIDPDGTGFSEVLRVASAQAAANPALAELGFPVEVSEGLTVSEADGGFVASDAAGVRVFTSPTPLMWDSGSATAPAPAPAPASAPDGGSGVSGTSASTGAALVAGVDETSGEPVADDLVVAPGLDSAVMPMPVEVSGGSVTLTPDAGMLADPGTSWPVFIDPGVSGSRHEWTALRSGMSSDYKFSGDQGLGFCDVSVTSACGRDFTSRLVWEFHGLSKVSNVAAGDITSATFSAYGTHSFNCTAYAVQAFNVESIVSGTTWGSNSGWTAGNRQSTRSVAHRPGCDGEPRRIAWDIKQAAQEAASYNHAYITIGLRAADESTMAKWKRYKNTAKLSVSYNRAPVMPTTKSMKTTASGSNLACSTSKSGTDSIRTTRPTLRAHGVDPDGQKVRLRFKATDVATGDKVWQSSLTTARASGQQHTVKVPSGVLKDERVYRWRAESQDPGGRKSGWSDDMCYIRPDMTPPNKPTVTSNAYPENRVNGEVGTSGTFKFGPNGSKDVVKYKYSFNSDALNRHKPGSSASVSFTPESGGSQVLYVQSFDKAGRGSPVNVYRFSVAFPTVSGLWHLDEGSGTQASDAAPAEVAGQEASHPLTLSDASMWAPAGWDGGGSALTFGAGEAAHTDGPVLDTSKSYTVSAFVDLAATDTHRFAVSQDGQFSSAFKLGYLRDSSRCDGGAAGCWAFLAYARDGGGGLAATSPVPAVTDTWVHLTGVYDAGASTSSNSASATLKLYVCGGATDWEPRLATMVSLNPDGLGWSAGGDLQAGRAQYSAKATQGWAGQIDDVRAYDVALGEDQIRRVCWGSQVEF
ncbi:hypothetical protein GCM10007368_28360 [Isoptericola cucumis]|uniref:LamG-like jellyroll fold domain-containing protein n=2 Tax=Isoptericola cucumis TaxID=1776856 RepID=A0ABQ2B9J1_9MICO|nr:hypothetical protein GCM10007368_28360 [Isoptericola cucumis]